MKVFKTAILIFLAYHISNAQTSGKIEYTETIKLEVKFDGMTEDMKKMIPQSHSQQKELIFEGDLSLYKTKKGEVIEDVNMESDDGSFKIQFKMDDEVDDILYKDLVSKHRTHQKGILGKPFILEDNLQTYGWKLTGEKIKYLDYECHKAVIEKEDEFIIAWYTPSIPVQIGPNDYHGLPGAILMLSINDGKKEYKATEVQLDFEVGDSISKPKGYKVVDQVTFDKIEKEKEAEIRKMFASKKRN